jgi:hypothetical protein
MSLRTKKKMYGDTQEKFNDFQISFVFLQHYPQHLLDRRLGGPQSSGIREKNTLVCDEYQILVISIPL